MIDRIKQKITHWEFIIERRLASRKFTEGHQVKLYNWTHPFDQDRWLIDFIEKRGLLDVKPKARVALYSIFGPMWLSALDRADIRLFVERENLHKSHFETWLHRFLDDNRIDLSLGFDRLEHCQYMRFPFWIMWSVFSPTATYQEIKTLITQLDSSENHSYTNRKYCAFLRGHDDVGCKVIYDQFSSVSKVDCDGRLFHNNDELKTVYSDNKLEYLKNYRFNLTPENSNQKDYVTEKLFEAIYAGCIPIYNGSGNAPELDILNKDAIIFIDMNKYDNNNAIKLVQSLNNNKERYMQFASQKRFTPEAADIIYSYYDELENRLRELIANI